MDQKARDDVSRSPNPEEQGLKEEKEGLATGPDGTGPVGTGPAGVVVPSWLLWFPVLRQQ